jgi:nickel-dependent lactate racemase
MQTFNMHYGDTTLDFSIDENNLLQIVKSNPFNLGMTEDEIILNSLANPIGTPRLKNIVKPGNTVCIVIPDATRAWQKTYKFLYRIVEELNNGGILDKDIIFISATGTHRKQTEEEHKSLLGSELYKRFKIIDHDCLDNDNLVYLGKTSYGTPVRINKLAMDCDHIVITGGIVYHLLAGWAGGKKSILPGISSYETIMANHALSLGENIGDGSNPLVKSGSIANNPVHKDMLEATGFVKPSFMFNVIMGPDGNIAAAVSGDYVEAHSAGRELVNKIDGVKIHKKADLVIASAGGYPKDINLYQSSKTMINMNEAAKDGATLILLSQCREGLGGDDDIKDIILNYDNILDREKSLRERYSISKFIGYYACEIADKYDFIMVSDIDQALVKNAHIKVVSTIDEALNIVYEKRGKNLETILMPKGANTLPILEE